MPRRTLSPKESYGVLMKHAAVVVGIRDSEQEIIQWETKWNKKDPRAPFIVFVDPHRKVTCFEISFVKSIPYGQTRNNPQIGPREHAPVEITPLLWEYMKYVIGRVAEERREGKRVGYADGHPRRGRRYWSKGKSLALKDYFGFKRNGFRNSFEYGFFFGVSNQDQGILERLFAEESKSLYWRRRLDWFAARAECFMAGWELGSRRGAKALRFLAEAHVPEGFFRKEIFPALLRRISRSHRFLFLDALEKFKIFSGTEKEGYLSLAVPKATSRRDAAIEENRVGVRLNFLCRGLRETGVWRFEVRKPFEERTREW